MLDSWMYQWAYEIRSTIFIHTSISLACNSRHYMDEVVSSYKCRLFTPTNCRNRTVNCTRVNVFRLEFETGWEQSLSTKRQIDLFKLTRRSCKINLTLKPLWTSNNKRNNETIYDIGQHLCHIIISDQ